MGYLLHINLPVLTVITLRTLALCAPTRTSHSASADADSPSGEPPSEGPSPLSRSPIWDVFIAVTMQHKAQFEEEFSKEHNYSVLDRTQIPSQPQGCTVDLNLEACLLRLVHGLQVYKVLLQHVKEVYPDNELLPNIKYRGEMLIQLLKNGMKHPERVTGVSDVEAATMVQVLDNLNTFNKKLTAHSILRKFHFFLIDSKRELARKEKRISQRRQQSVTMVDLNSRVNQSQALDTTESLK